MKRSVVGIFKGRTADMAHMHFQSDSGSEFRADPFVGCVVIPNDYDPFTDDAKDYIQPHDYQIKEEELSCGKWEIYGEHYLGSFLIHSMKKVETPHA